MKATLIGLALLAPLSMGAADLPNRTYPMVAFEEFSDDIGDAGREETRVLLTSAREYAALFGHEAPKSVDFGREWVVFYSAGIKPTGGYDASVLDIRLTENGRSLLVTTSLVSPGPGCIVTLALTKPYALVKLEATTRDLNVVRFAACDVEIDCSR